MAIAIVQMIIFQIALPAAFIISLWRKTFHSKIEWAAEALMTIVYITWVFCGSTWDWFSYYWRYIWLILLFAAVFRSWQKGRSLPVRIKFNNGQKWTMGVNVFLIFVFGLYSVWIFKGFTADGTAVELEFPLKSGAYYVGQGGNAVQINYHNEFIPQQYALDIVELNGLGMRAKGLYPKELDRYAIYGETLYSPCTGKIVEARNDLPDLIPPKADSKNPEGNYVNIACEGVNVLIAHMKEGSSAVKAGDSIEKGQKIGLVGNSGNTSEPHLHIHAEKDGVGIPIEFDGRFLVRNSLVK